MSSEKSFRNRIIEFQNKAEKDFETKKSFLNGLSYLLAFMIFMGSTILAGFRYPFAKLFKKSKSTSTQKGEIHIITSENIESIFSTNEIVLLDFWAEWCGPCIMMNPVLELFAKENKDILVGKIDADSQAELVKRFQIRGLPQILLIKNGNEIKRNAGALSQVELKKFTS